MSNKNLQRAQTDPDLDYALFQAYKSKHAYSRKHSSGDLHSRLKTRKLLGVGETDDGNVHRSKLSQILGHSEQLYVKLPRGLRAWQCFTTAIFITLAVWAFVFPANFYSRLTSGPTSHSATSVLPLRLYAVAMMSFAVFSYSNYRCTDRDSIRISMLSGIVYFSLHSLEQLCTGHLDPLLLVFTTAYNAISVHYFCRLSTPKTNRPK